MAYMVEVNRERASYLLPYKVSIKSWRNHEVFMKILRAMASDKDFDVTPEMQQFSQELLRKVETYWLHG